MFAYVAFRYIRTTIDLIGEIWGYVQDGKIYDGNVVTSFVIPTRK